MNLICTLGGLGVIQKFNNDNNDKDVSQIRYLLVVILELNSVSEVQYKGMMTDRWWKVSTGIIDVVKSEI